MAEWLEQRRQRYYVVINVPRPLYKAIGKRALVQSTGIRVDDYAMAFLKGQAIKAEFEKQIEDARRRQQADAVIAEAAGQGRDVTVLLAEAADWHTHAADRVRARYSAELAAHPDTRSFLALSEVDSAADLVARQHGSVVAQEYHAVAEGVATPLASHVDAYLAEGGKRGPFSPRTAALYQAYLAHAFDWLASQDVRTIERVTPKLAGAYAQHLKGTKIHSGTVAKNLDALIGYWSWLPRIGFEGTNPWAGKRPARRNARHGRAEDNRPFTDAEVSRLLGGKCRHDLHDAMMIAALSGLRLEEIYQLRVGDCTNGIFDIKQGKTPAAIRAVPIHSRLAETALRLCKDKKARDYLMPANENDRRSNSVSGRFATYRRSLGIEDLRSGGRSRVNFHSFRRWFTTAALRAGIAPHVVDQVTGHALQGETLATYFGGSAADELRACVEAVTLPKPG